MILMHHHVCPRDQMPRQEHRSSSEGWSYNIEPVYFEQQLRRLKKRGTEFVSLDEYVIRCQQGCLKWGTTTVTFDDGWLDNFNHAFPVLKKLKVPASHSPKPL